MNKRKTTSHPTPEPRGQAGFTLVELLVVIAIITLLGSLLTPTVMKFITQTYLTRSAVRVKTLHEGIMVYKEKTGFFPGERTEYTKGLNFTNDDPREAMKAGTLTGSQVLAACLFGIGYKNVAGTDYSLTTNSNNIKSSKVYTTFKPEFLLKYDTSITGSGSYIFNSISDGFPKDKARPICYYLASKDPELRRHAWQFQYSHNAAYMKNQKTPDLSQGTAGQEALNTWISNRSSGTTGILNAGEFILIAPGLNREYIRTESSESIEEPDPDDIANNYGRSN